MLTEVYNYFGVLLIGWLKRSVTRSNHTTLLSTYEDQDQLLLPFLDCVKAC